VELYLHFAINLYAVHKSNFVSVYSEKNTALAVDYVLYGLPLSSRAVLRQASGKQSNCSEREVNFVLKLPADILGISKCIL
jgi:hypothetical protein